jgi:hypothetical protein
MRRKEAFQLTIPQAAQISTLLSKGKLGRREGGKQDEYLFLLRQIFCDPANPRDERCFGDQATRVGKESAGTPGSQPEGKRSSGVGQIRHTAVRTYRPLPWPPHLLLLGMVSASERRTGRGRRSTGDSGEHLTCLREPDCRGPSGLNCCGPRLVAKLARAVLGRLTTRCSSPLFRSKFGIKVASGFCLLLRKELCFVFI